jgi:hypothetical protein
MSYDADVARARRLLPLVKEEFAVSLTEAATRFAISHQRWAASRSVWQRRSSSRMRSPLFKKVGCHPLHSVACQGCYTHSLGSSADRRERLTAKSCIMRKKRR